MHAHAWEPQDKRSCLVKMTHGGSEGLAVEFIRVNGRKQTIKLPVLLVFSWRSVFARSKAVHFTEF